MLEIKNTVTEIKNACDSPISRLHTAEETLPVPEGMSTETSQTEKQNKRIEKTQNGISRNCYKKCYICIMKTPGEREKVTEYLKQ